MGARVGTSIAEWPLLVWSQKSRYFAANQTYEGARKHFVGLPSGVLKIVVWVSQHIKKSLNKFFILEDFLMIFRCIQSSISYYVLYKLFIVLIVSDVRDLEASGAVGLVGLEVNPQTPGASCEGNRPLICLTRLIGGDGCC